MMEPGSYGPAASLMDLEGRILHIHGALGPVHTSLAFSGNGLALVPFCS